jgi:hypothetical protein
MKETIKKYIKPFSARKKAFFICETPILKAKRIEIGKLNNPAIGGGYNTPRIALRFIPVIVQFQRKLKTLQKNGSPYENGLALIYS